MLKLLKTFNDLLALLYLPFVLVWLVLVCLAVKFLNMSTVEALGLGTATGILLAILKDIFQFYFRRAQEDKQPPTGGG